jgi:glyoxylase-like metal-dependent hydrolase (beta-lactamase superfamily II)/rhodanese-related sulfurtransferase
MKIDQYYLECLSQASYLIADESSGLAAVVDPRRDIDEYLRDADAAGLTIAYVIETHFHADFLSGHLELAAATGAQIIFGDAARPGFPARLVHDGERITMGEVELEFLATPGHTPESISVVVRDMSRADGDERPAPAAVLTGDTLFIGDVGRPDLLASVGVTAHELGASLYDSLREKLMVLPDETLVYPAHGAGSACGKNLSTETVSTIGEQKRSNYALAAMTADEFIAVVTADQPSAPAYFLHAVASNKADRELVELAPAPLLALSDAAARRAAGAVLLDVRDSVDFAGGHLVGSVNVGIDGRFAEYVGMVVRPDDDIVVLAPSTAEADEARLRMARIGFDNVVGVVDDIAGRIAAQPELAEPASRLTATVLLDRQRELPDLCVVDIRNDGERKLSSIPGTVHIPMAELPRRLTELDLDRPIVVHCAGGYRSSVAASWLRAQGATDVSDLLGGIAAWEALDPATAAPA